MAGWTNGDGRGFPQDAGAGLFLVALAAIGLWLAWELPVGTMRAMGPGMLPRALCFLVGAAGIGRPPGRAGGRAPDGIPTRTGPHRRGGPGSSIHYAAAKGGVVNLTRELALELALVLLLEALELLAQALEEVPKAYLE